MSLEFKERSVSSILYNINAFWSSSLMQDQHIVSQIWRGYHGVIDNLNLQLNQLHYAKSINTIPHSWQSHWERFDFNSSNATETFNALYPFAYKLPDGVRSVYLLRESPREISILPALTMILNNGAVVLPDGSVRLPGDLIYPSDEWMLVRLPCPNCENKSESESACELCGGEGEIKAAASESGFGVESVKYYKRADDIADYHEGVYPLGDFVVDEVGKRIAFKAQPYETLWSEHTVRDTEIIYDNFGTLIKYYKKDSFNYLRQLQGLWYAYWHGAAINNLSIGVNVLSEMPFVTDPGYVENISFLKNSYLISTEIKSETLPSKLPLPAYPSAAENNQRDLILINRDKPGLRFTEGVDYEIIYAYDDDGQWDEYGSMANESGENSEIPSQYRHAYIAFYDTETTRSVSAGNILDAYFRDGSGYYVVTVSGKDYLISDETAPSVVLNQYLSRFEPLTSEVNIYDYKNHPKWWESLLGKSVNNLTYLKSGRGYLDSILSLDSDVSLDGYVDKIALSEVRYHHTFIVSLEESAVPRTVSEISTVRAFLDTIKPSYSHYIILNKIYFEDDITTRDPYFKIFPTLQITDAQGPMQRLDDTWVRGALDGDNCFDQERDYEQLLVMQHALNGYDFRSEMHEGLIAFDSLDGKILDSGNFLDSYSIAEKLLVAYLPLNGVNFSSDAITGLIAFDSIGSHQLDSGRLLDSFSDSDIISTQ